VSRLQPPRGTHDLLADDNRRHRRITDVFRGVAEGYGFGQIATPIFEFTEVFKRTLGETSDVVSKEMYTFDDRSGASLTLRPEYTAGIVRALISGGLGQHLPLRFYAWGPMFRYERPQKGRLRQFHQIDAEILGVPEVQADTEVIALAADLLDALGLGAVTTLEINSLGDPESRAAYRSALVDYFSRHEQDLSQDSRQRLSRNPLRILDSKDPGDRALIEQAPPMEESLNTASCDFFARLRDGLTNLGIAFSINRRLVRGLDYYTHTAFEFTTTALGAQGAVIAGGRYDGLVAQMGGPQVAGVGWAGGIERLALLIDQPPPPARPLAMVPVGEEAQDIALDFSHRLRRAGIAVDMGYRGNLGKRLKRANRQNARAAIIIGGDELAAGAAVVRDLDSGAQLTVAFAQLVNYFTSGGGSA